MLRVDEHDVEKNDYDDDDDADVDLDGDESEEDLIQSGDQIDEEDDEDDVLDHHLNQQEQEQQPQQQNYAHFFVFTNDKAGMASVDRQKVNQVVYDMSKNSKFFKNELRKQKKAAERVERMKKKLLHYEHNNSSNNNSSINGSVESLIKELESTRDLTRTWMHVDMDAFFANVEIRDNPSLADKPVAVGGIGMVSAANYVARKYGVRSAMPGFIALKLCPELIFVSCNFQKYREASQQVRQILKKYDPNAEAMSLDESYLDLTEFLEKTEGNAGEVAARIRSEIFEMTKLTASAGIACNKMLAKICSDMNKPNGQYVLASEVDAIKLFMEKLPIRKIPGIGKVSEQELREGLGISTCGDLIAKRGLIASVAISSGALRFLLSSCLGISDAHHREKGAVGTKGGRKSISQERTFRDLENPKTMENICCTLAKQVSDEMKERNIEGKLLTLKMKSHDFSVRSKSTQLADFSMEADDFIPVALRLLRAEFPLCLRLLGLRLSNLRTKSTQPKKKQVAISTYIHQNDDISGTPITHVLCPICNEDLGTNACGLQVNCHIDDCLRKQKVKQNLNNNGSRKNAPTTPLTPNKATKQQRKAGQQSSSAASSSSLSILSFFNKN